MLPLISQKNNDTQGRGLQGQVTVPGDKSISHRALLFASQTVGTTAIHGLLEGEDVLHTADALRKLGVAIEKEGCCWIVKGVGVGGLTAAEDVLYMGNSGTAVRLMMGLLASYPFTSFFSGDASLNKRPMRRVITPLQEMGAQFDAREDTFLPLSVRAGHELLPVTYTLPVASAQVKSAILLAGLNTAGKTTVIEPKATRDHSELMLRYLGAEVDVQPHEDGGKAITITGQPELLAKDVVVPGDPSSAAFLVVAALIVPNSELTIADICINPLRTGLYRTLQEMGADIHFSNQREEAGEVIADITVKTSALKGVDVPAERAPSMIDEYPILSVAAAVAEGTTTMHGLEELKVKESNRLQAIADGLEACGVAVEMGEDTLVVTGGAVPGGGTVVTHMDHRIAMAFLVLGLVSERPVTVDDGSMIATSFPGFVELMNGIGAKVTGHER